MLASILVAGACGGGGDQPEPVQATAQPESGSSGAGGSSGQTDSEDTGTAAEDSPTAAEDATAAPEADSEPLLAPVDTTTTTAPASAEPAPRSGGTLRVAVEAESDGLNPAANNFAASAYAMAYPLFDPVAYFDTEGTGSRSWPSRSTGSATAGSGT